MNWQGKAIDKLMSQEIKLNVSQKDWDYIGSFGWNIRRIVRWLLK